MGIGYSAATIYRLDTAKATEEEQLVAAAKLGDETALTLLFQRYSARIYKILLRILRNREDAQDAMQEAFLRVFLHMNTFEGKAKFSSWLTRIAINLALMELRKKRGHRTLSLDGGNGGDTAWLLDVADHRADTHNACEVAELTDELARAIARLKPVLREPLELKLRLDCSQEDLAQLTNNSISVIKSRIFRAKRTLRASLKRR